MKQKKHYFLKIISKNKKANTQFNKLNGITKLHIRDNKQKSMLGMKQNTLLFRKLCIIMETKH